MADPRHRPAVALEMPNEREHRRQLAARANASLPHDGSGSMTAPLRLLRVTAAELTGTLAPDLWEGALVYVSDEAGGGVPAWSDGSDWRRVSDGDVVSAA